MRKITEADLAGKGVLGMPDTPGLSATDMQEKMEEITRDVVIPHFNALAEDMENTYSKEETEEIIRQRVVDIGAGDMAQGIYDADGDKVVDETEKLANSVKIGNAQFDGTKDISLADMGAATAEQGKKIDDLTTDVRAIKVVTAKPATAEEKTLYLVLKQG